MQKRLTMTRRTVWWQRSIAGATALILVIAQCSFPPRAEAALGSSTASAGSAPPPAATAIQSFQPDLFTGRATTSIPIAVPPGRKGMQPSLGLAYSSSSRNGEVGVGWSLDVGYIERSTKHGVPKYDSADTYTFLFQGVSSDLVQIPDGTYRAKDEGLFLKFINRDSAGWEVRDKAGTRYQFGKIQGSRLEAQGNIFRWNLDQITDTHGNTLTVSYTTDQAQLYLDHIDYTGHEPTHEAPTNQVSFVWEARPDAETSYRSGFAVTTAHRLHTIETKAMVDGELRLARRYELRYTPSPRTSRSLLSSVAQVGHDGATRLPPVTFAYTDDAPRYLHCHNCVPAISTGTHSWQLQTSTGHLFPNNEGGNDQRLWPSGYFEPGYKVWNEKVCHRVLFWRHCEEVQHAAAIPQVPWSAPHLELAGSAEGISWSTEANGNLSASGPSDAHLLAITWLYSQSGGTASLSSLGVSGRAEAFYVQPGGSTWTAASGGSVPLASGWTVVAVTAYNEIGGFNLSIGGSLAGQVQAMNHAQFSPMGLTGDFNGDGYADLAHLEPATNHWHVALNSPSGFGQEQAWLNTTLPSETATLVGDVDADGKTDLLLWNTSSGQWQVAKSTGTRFDAPVTWHPGFGAGQTPFMGDFNGDQLLDVGTFKDGAWQIARSDGSRFTGPDAWLTGWGAGATPLTGDFNGDGLTDVAAASGGTVSVAFSTGAAFAPSSTWVDGFGSGHDLTTADVNGDGLTDVLYYDTSSGVAVCALSTGRGFGPAQSLMSEHPFSLRGPEDRFQVGDFKGSGLAGFGMFNPTSGAAEIAFAMGAQPDLLRQVDNGLGGVSAITYAPSTMFDNAQDGGAPSLPFVLPVVTKVEVSDGLGHTYTTRYRYRGGVYDGPTREFRGFRTATVSDVAGTTTQTTFAQDEHTKGRPLSAEVRDANDRLYTQTTNTWTCEEPYPGVHVAHLDQTDAGVYDGNASHRDTRARFQYDPYGNLTQAVNEGWVRDVRVDEQGHATETLISGDERTTTTAYLYDEAAWILSKPQLTQTRDTQGTVVAQRRFAYDPTTGDLSKEEEWLNLPQERWLATTLTYDASGNVHTVTDALGRTTTNTYDTAAGTYLVQIENVLGHTRQLTYDPRTGQVLRSTDQNGLTTLTDYDPLGRVIATKFLEPGATEPVTLSEFTYDLSTTPAKTTTCVFAEPTHHSPLCTLHFSDGLGRTIQARSPAEDPEKQVVTGAVEFDARGLVVKQWVPYLADVSERYVPLSPEPSAPSLAFVSYAYDPVGRLIKTTEPNGTDTLIDYDDGETTTTLGPTQTQQLVDPYGRLIKVEEVLSEEVMHTTTYAYDALGDLTQVTDASGNLTRIAYDSLGRKLSMDDPDMGHWSYAYDDVDNLLSQTDARGVTTTFEYDPLNRLTRKTYAAPRNSGVVAPAAVTYAYDLPPSISAAPLPPPEPPAPSRSGTPVPVLIVQPARRAPARPATTGKLTGITDGSGSSRFAYDEFGRLISESKTIEGKAYTIRRTYDLLGRLTTLTYPDGDIATYTYNPQGGLETIQLQSIVNSPQSIVNNIDYNSAGQITRIEYGNGVVTDYTYNPQTLRLSELVTRNSSLGTLQDFSYDFDPLGNVAGITDAVHTGSQAFEYDALNRLTRATGAYGDLQYRYDAIGNMLEKDMPAGGATAASATGGGLMMNYGVLDPQTGQRAKPHAVTSVHSPQSIVHGLSDDNNENLLEQAIDYGPSTIDLAYDANGNLVEKAMDRGPSTGDFAAQRLAYDAENRLIRVDTAPEETVELHFAPGWNFFSLPVIPDDAHITAIFPNFSADFEQLAWFDATPETPEAHRFQHFVNDPIFNDFDTLQYGQGYQAYCTNPNGVTVRLTGKLPTTIPVTTLLPGWHLLPAITLNSKLSTQTLFRGIDATQLLRYDTVSGSLTTVERVEPGQAYFVQVRSSSTWHPPLPREVTTTTVYDGDGGRVKQRTPSGTTTYLGESVELAADGTVTKYVFAGAQRIASLTRSTRSTTSAPSPPSRLGGPRSGKLPPPPAKTLPPAPALRFYHTDHLGSSNVLTDATGAVVELHEYTPFGSVSAQSPQPAAHSPFGFTGQRQDAANGLIRFPARAYDPQLGRFLQPDPFVQDPSDPQTLNRYAYVRNNPLRFVDPSGYSFLSKLFAAIAAIVVFFLTEGNVYAAYATFQQVDAHVQQLQGDSPNTFHTALVLGLQLGIESASAATDDPTGTSKAAGQALSQAVGNTLHEKHVTQEAQDVVQDLGVSPGRATAAISRQLILPQPISHSPAIQIRSFPFTALNQYLRGPLTDVQYLQQEIASVDQNIGRIYGLQGQVGRVKVVDFLNKTFEAKGKSADETFLDAFSLKSFVTGELARRGEAFFNESVASTLPELNRRKAILEEQLRIKLH